MCKPTATPSQEYLDIYEHIKSVHHASVTIALDSRGLKV